LLFFSSKLSINIEIGENAIAFFQPQLHKSIFSAAIKKATQITQEKNNATDLWQPTLLFTSCPNQNRSRLSDRWGCWFGTV
jgi:hypothetical protein